MGFHQIQLGYEPWWPRHHLHDQEHPWLVLTFQVITKNWDAETIALSDLYSTSNSRIFQRKVNTLIGSCTPHWEISRWGAILCSNDAIVWAALSLERLDCHRTPRSSSPAWGPPLGIPNKDEKGGFWIGNLNTQKCLFAKKKHAPCHAWDCVSLHFGCAIQGQCWWIWWSYRGPWISVPEIRWRFENFTQMRS